MSSLHDILNAIDLTEEARVMDGNILRQEKFSSASIGERVIITYLDSGSIDTIEFEALA